MSKECRDEVDPPNPILRVRTSVKTPESFETAPNGA